MSCRARAGIDATRALLKQRGCVSVATGACRQRAAVGPPAAASGSAAGARAARFGRRPALAAAGRGAVAMLGAALVGCARQGSARPTLANSSIHLVWAASWQGAGSYASRFPSLVQPAVQHWESQNRGVRLKIIPGSGSNGSNLGQTGTISAILAGDGPDVFTGCCTDVAAFDQADMMLPLDALLQRDNVRTDIWAAPHVALRRSRRMP